MTPSAPAPAAGPAVQAPAWLAYRRLLGGPLLRAVEILAALLMAADLAVVFASVMARYLLHDSFAWTDEVARALLVALTFFGAAAALGRDETIGIDFFVRRLPSSCARSVEAFTALVEVLVSAALAWDAFTLTLSTIGQTTATGLPQNLFFVPIIGAGAVMTVFAGGRMTRHRLADVAAAVLALLALAGAWALLGLVAEPDPLLAMLAGFLICLLAGVPVAYVLAFATLVFLAADGSLPGAIFAQQTVSGIDNFVLLAVPFFILTGFAMEANGMSVRLIDLLQRLLGRVRGGLDVVMVVSMVIFSGISGSKMADVAAVGSILIPAARRSGRNPGQAVALLAASAVMAETIPPCVNLIILGFVANLSIGGLFVAGLVPSALMALALILVCVAFPARGSVMAAPRRGGLLKLWGSAALALGMILIIFGGYRSGFATATEISAFAVVYALVVGGVVFRELTPGKLLAVCVTGASRSGMVLFIVAAAQSVAFVLTIEQIPHELAALMIRLSASYGSGLFLVISILLLVVMGSMLEGAPALIIFGPLLVPVAQKLGIDPLHYGIVMIVAMGIGLFAPPLGVGLYGSCAVGDVPIERTVRPILLYLGILFLCLLLIAFVAPITMALPRAAGF